MCFRFKTPEQTEAFIAKFREAVSGASIVSKTPEKAAEPSKASEPAAPPANLMDKFKPKAGSWECPGCFIRQPGDCIQCPACGTAKPGHEEEVRWMFLSVFHAVGSSKFSLKLSKVCRS